MKIRPELNDGRGEKMLGRGGISHSMTAIQLESVHLSADWKKNAKAKAHGEDIHESRCNGDGDRGK